MATLTYRTVNKLIERAYRIINVKTDDRNLTGDQVTEGLYSLNVLIDELSGLGMYLPLFSEYEVALTPGERELVFSEYYPATGINITQLSHVSIIENDTLYPVEILSDTLYFEGNSLTATGRPTKCYFINRMVPSLTIKRLVESVIVFYKIPDKAYTCSIKAKIKMTNQALNTDIDGIPPYMIFYLENALARMLHRHYPASKWDEIDETYYKQSKDDIIAANAKNLDINDTSIFRQNNYITDLSTLSR